MSKVIRISEETFIRLQEHAEPLVDTPATVIDRLLEFYERQQRKPENPRRMLAARLTGSDSFVMESRLSAPLASTYMAGDVFGDFDYPTITPSLFLAPASRDHVEATVQRTVPYAKAERFILPRQRIQLKRAIEDASTFHCYGMSESDRPVFESMRPGDHVLIMVARSIELNFLARIATKFESEELGRELWPVKSEEDRRKSDKGGSDREVLSLIYAIDEVQNVSVDSGKLNKVLGYGSRYRMKGAKQVDPKRLEPQLARFGSVEGLLRDL
ncbi:MAG: hypothetical protein ACC655_07585 [Rhodothermia bacterium]